jgi:type IV secretion system protein TrbL
MTIRTRSRCGELRDQQKCLFSGRGSKCLNSIKLLATVLLSAAVVAVLTGAAFAQSYTTTVPTDILAQYRQARQLWTTNIWVYANALFGLLAVIEFAWSAAVMLLEKSDLQSWTAALVRKIMWIGAFYMLLLNGRVWIPAIIDSFNQIGAGAAGFGVTLSPGDIFSQGLTIAAALVDAASGAGFLTNPGTSLSMALAALLIVVAYIVITLNFVVTVVESYLVVSVGFIFLGFGGSRWTVPYLERYIGLAVSIGIKIVLLYCLISAGLGLGNGWLAEAQGVGTAPHPSMTAFDVMGAALIFMMLCWQIPKLFAAVLGGAPALTGGDLISTGVMVASAGVALASSTAAGVSALAGASGALANTGSGAPPSSGSSGVSNAVAGVSSASSNGSGGSSAMPPPSSPRGDAASGMGARRQPEPPVSGTGSISLAFLGGEPLGGSGFENETPARGFSAGSNGPSSDAQTTNIGSTATPVAPPSPTAPEAAGPRTVSQRIQNFRRRLPALPSDAAPHATPPRMPIDQHE